jgi:hypothetical protein
MLSIMEKMDNELVADFEIRFLQDVLKMLDERIKNLDSRIDPDDSEGSIYYEPIEHLHGVGFVTSQRYILSISNLLEIDKETALDQGPQKHNISIAKIVNATANYWKHIEEYNSSIRKGTSDVLEALGITVEASYCSVNVLYKCEYDNFMELSEGLVEWRNELLELIICNNQ